MLGHCEIRFRLEEVAQSPCMIAIVENPLLIDFEVDNWSNAFASLKELGPEQGNITRDDVLHSFPEVEHDVDYVNPI